MLAKIGLLLFDTQIWIGLVAALSGWYSFELNGINSPERGDFCRLLFWATLCSYNFHQSFPDQPSAGQPYLARALSLLGLLGAIYYLIRLKTVWVYILPLSVSTFFYSAPKIPCWPFMLLRGKAKGKTLYLSAHWWFICAFLPVWIWSEMAWSAVWFLLHRAWLILSIAALFDHKDRDIDRKNGLKTLIGGLAWADLKKNLLFFAFFGWIFAFLLYICNSDKLAFASCILASGLFLPYVLREEPSKPPFWYYPFLDGLWAVGALLYLAKF